MKAAYEMSRRWGRVRVLFRCQAEDGIRDDLVTGVQTCALPIFNAALDLIRSRGHREVVPVERADELQSNSSASPERALSSLEIKNWLRRELATLNPRTAEMFALRYLEGLDNSEIARTMNTSQAVVAVTLHRTRARLKKSLRGFMKGAS